MDDAPDNSSEGQEDDANEEEEEDVMEEEHVTEGKMSIDVEEKEDEVKAEPKQPGCR